MSQHRLQRYTATFHPQQTAPAWAALDFYAINHAVAESFGNAIGGMTRYQWVRVERTQPRDDSSEHSTVGTPMGKGG